MNRFFIVLICLVPLISYADTTIKVHTVTTDSQPPSNVENQSDTRDIYYRKGSMRRKDTLGSSASLQFSEIANCDRRTGFLIDLNAHEYRTYKVVKFTPTAALEMYLKNNPQNVVDIESKTVDTGERKMFFGQLAKHFITTTTRSSDGQNAGGEEIIDAWHTEHQSGDNNCAPDFVHTEPFYAIGTALVTYPQIPRFHHIGPIPTGLPVKLKATHKTPGEKNSIRVLTVEETVEELKDDDVNPSLFELPSGVKENPRLLGAK